MQTISRVSGNLESVDGKVSRIDRTVSESANTILNLERNLISGQTRAAAHVVQSAGERHMAVSPKLERAYSHITAPHKVLLWPAIRSRLLTLGMEFEADIKDAVEEGTPWFLRRELSRQPYVLPPQTGFPVDQPKLISTSAHQHRVTFPSFTIEQMTEYAHFFFNSFHILYPILDRSTFMEVTLPSLYHKGFGDTDCESIIALLVFALGKMAQEATLGEPISAFGGKESGIRGGTADIPPAIEIFNEARRRTCFVTTQCDIENIQVFLLTAMYYGGCARQFDFWRSEIAAAAACEILIKCNQIKWYSPRGSLIRKAFWVCLLIETWYYCDLDLPRTGLWAYEDVVPLPGDDSQNTEDQQIQLQFLAQLTIRRLIINVHATIFDGELEPDRTVNML